MKVDIYYTLFTFVSHDPLGRDTLKNWWKNEHGRAIAYRHVAIVRVRDLEQAFEVSNNQDEFDGPWYERPEVLWVNPEAEDIRSTSVGDIFVSEGIASMVDRVGFTQI